MTGRKERNRNRERHKAWRFPGNKSSNVGETAFSFYTPSHCFGLPGELSTATNINLKPFTSGAAFD